VTPGEERVSEPRAWFAKVIDMEIDPLLDEYRLDAPERSQAAITALREGL
jgi:hypothetical protein